MKTYPITIIHMRILNILPKDKSSFDLNLTHIKSFLYLTGLPLFIVSI